MMSESRLTKGHKTYVSGNAGSGRLRRTNIDLIGEVLQKGKVSSTHNQRACMIKCMNVDEAKGVCKDCSRWRSVVGRKVPWEKGASLCMYVFYLLFM